MVTPQAQIKVNLSVSLKEYIESKAQKFGMPMASYIKHLILKDVEEMEYPIFKASTKTEKAYKQALEEQREDKLIPVKDVDKFFEEL